MEAQREERLAQDASSDASIGDNLGTLIDELKEKRTRMGRTLRLSVTVLLQAVLRREEN